MSLCNGVLELTNSLPALGDATAKLETECDQTPAQKDSYPHSLTYLLNEKEIQRIEMIIYIHMYEHSDKEPWPFISVFIFLFESEVLECVLYAEIPTHLSLAKRFLDSNSPKSPCTKNFSLLNNNLVVFTSALAYCILRWFFN